MKSLLLILLFPAICFSQDTLHLLTNPSFEDSPRKGDFYAFRSQHEKNKIKGWFDCGILDRNEPTAPDIHSAETDYWGVKVTPSDGLTCLGLGVREDNSYESVSQELKTKLEKGKCYTFTVDLCSSTTFMSRVRNNPKALVPFTDPVTLRVWSGYGNCGFTELLYQSPPINHEEWQSYTVHLQPKYDAGFIMIEAYYTSPIEKVNGNLLVDNISDFIVKECEN